MSTWKLDMGIIFLNQSNKDLFHYLDNFVRADFHVGRADGTANCVNHFFVGMGQHEQSFSFFGNFTDSADTGDLQ